MQTKFLILILLTAIVLTGIVSAATFTATLDGDLTKADDTVVLTITDTSGFSNTVTIGAISAITDGTNSLSVSGAGIVYVPASGFKTVNLTYTGDTSKFAFGTFSTNVVLTNGSDTKTLTLNFNSEFCDDGCKKTYTDGAKYYKLSMDIDKMDIIKGFGPEDNEWYPADEVEIQLDFDNNGDEDIDDIMIEVCLYDENADKCVIDEGDMEVDDNFNLDSGDDISVLITYKVDPDDIEAGDYLLYIKAYSDDLGEENLCLEDSEDITIITDKFVLLDSVNIPEKVTCGEEVEITADVWNIDDNQQDDVSLLVYNKELGIDKKVEVGDIDEWDKGDVSFTITIPENTEEKSYPLKITVLDEDESAFETEEDNEESVFTYYLTVEGNCVLPTVKNAEITAVLETEKVKAGNPIVIKATVKNTGEEKTDYTIGVDGYEFFSTLESVEPATLTLEAGKTGDVLITLNLNKDASGDYEFNIKALFDAEEVSQPVSFTVEPGFSITGSAVGESFRENWFIWVIVAINIILIIAIIIVAAKMSRA